MIKRIMIACAAVVAVFSASIVQAQTLTGVEMVPTNAAQGSAVTAVALIGVPLLLAYLGLRVWKRITR